MIGVTLVMLTLLAQAERARWPGGWVDTVDCTHIEGWAADAHHPLSRRFVVQVLKDGKVVTEVDATTYRQDLDDNLEFGDGRYGFEVATPQSLRDGREHVVDIRIKGTKVLLSGSGQKLVCPHAHR